MPIQISCPSCTRPLRVPEDLLGSSVSCPNCQTTFTAAAPMETPPAPVPKPFASESAASQEEPSSPPAPGAGDVKVQIEPSEGKPRHDWREEDDDYPRPDSAYLTLGGAFQGRPHRGLLILILGIIGLAAAVFGMCPYLSLAEFIAFGLSLAAWLMGRRDLVAIKAGEIDPRGKDMTQAGWICGIIGTCLSALVIVVACGLIVFVIAVTRRY